MKNRPLVLITWLDACAMSADAWIELETLALTTPEICKSVGWLLADTPSSLTIVAHKTGSGAGSGDMTIPACNVISCEILRP